MHDKTQPNYTFLHVRLVVNNIFKHIQLIPWQKSQKGRPFRICFTIVDITITAIPPTTPYNPSSLFPTDGNSPPTKTSPHTNAYSERPYVATIFRNMRLFGDIVFRCVLRRP